MADTEFVRGAARLATRIASVQAALGLPALTGDIGKLLLRRTQERFDREVDPNEVPWLPLTEATLSIKRRQGYAGRGKLKRTLDLRNAIQIIRGGLGQQQLNTGAGVRIGIPDPRIAKYGRLHQSGAPNLPRRRFLGIGRLDVKAVDSLLRRKAAQLGNL